MALSDLVALFRCGGTWRDVDEWMALDAETRAALDLAGRTLEAERASVLAHVALRGDAGLAAALAGIDGGSLAGALAARAAAREAVERLRR